MGEYEIKGYDSAYKFATKIFSAYPKYVKSVVLFGSYAKNTEKEESDVDILIIIDDTIPIDQSFVGSFNFDVDRFKSEIKDVNLHVTIMSLTGFWQGLLSVDPFLINAIRYGFPLVDTGFFEPIKILLLKGMIKPTKEAIYAAKTRSDIFMDMIKKEKFTIVSDIYWSVVNSAQSLLMQEGKTPPSPETIPEELKAINVPEPIIHIYQEIHDYFKNMEHKQINDPPFTELEALLNKANTFNSFVASKIV